MLSHLRERSSVPACMLRWVANEDQIITLLDLRQRQAATENAISSGKQSDLLFAQSKVLFVFTAATVIFVSADMPAPITPPVRLTKLLPGPPLVGHESHGVRH